MSFDEMLTEKEAAEFLGVALSTLRKWRVRKRGPAYYKFEGVVRYGKSILEVYKKGTIVHTQG